MSNYNFEEIVTSVENEQKAKNVTPEPAAERSLHSLNCRLLIQAVDEKLNVAGVKDPNALGESMKLYATSLAKQWHGKDVMSSRIVSNYLRIHGGAEGGRGPEPDREEEKKKGEQHHQAQDDAKAGGQGQGQSPDQQQGQGQGQGQGDGQGEGEGEGQGQQQEGNKGKPKKVPAPAPAPMPETRKPEADGYIRPHEYDLIKYLLTVEHMDVSSVGPAGCGKTEIGIHIAKELGINMEIITAPQMVSDITGFRDAHGEFRDTPVTRAFENGGMLVIDELDRASAEALIALNGGLANGYLSTPKGVIRRSEELVVYATSNTAGFGASDEYVTANQLDASTRDRFFHVNVDYDSYIDLMCAGQDAGLAAFAQDYRQAVNQSCVNDAILSYRGVKAVNRLWDKQDKLIVMEGAVCKGLPTESLDSIYDRLEDKQNRYAMTLKKLIDHKKAVAKETGKY